MKDKRVFVAKDGRVLGIRCAWQHSGNRGMYPVARGSQWAQCAGCGAFLGSPQFLSRAEAIAADARAGVSRPLKNGL